MKWRLKDIGMLTPLNAVRVGKACFPTLTSPRVWNWLILPMLVIGFPWAYLYCFVDTNFASEK